MPRIIGLNNSFISNLYVKNFECDARTKNDGNNGTVIRLLETVSVSSYIFYAPSNQYSMTQVCLRL